MTACLGRFVPQQHGSGCSCTQTHSAARLCCSDSLLC
jgi:hypothetical protein